MSQPLSRDDVVAAMKAFGEQETMTFELKNHDYAGTSEPFSNLRRCTTIGIEPWVGVVVRMMDKMSRIESFVVQRKLLVNDEGIQQTLLDIAVYSKICRLLLREAGIGDEQPAATASFQGANNDEADETDCGCGAEDCEHSDSR